MTNAKNKGKRPMVDTGSVHSRRRLINGGTTNLSGLAGTNQLSKAQPHKEMASKENVKLVVPSQQPQNETVRTDEQLNKYGQDILAMKEDIKSIKEAVLSMCEKFATFEESFIQLQKQILLPGFKGSCGNISVTESGQPSNSKNDLFVCGICTETKASNESFSIQGCSHIYCTDCVVKYVAAKLEENITSICCLETECQGFLEPEYCRDILPQDLFARWGAALCESVILGDQKFYCPYKDCSILLIDDGEEFIVESECPSCRRMFCAQCKVPWHAGIECDEFKQLNDDEREKEDIMLMKVAQNEKWKRCPNCRYYVEKKDGCLYIKCRCGAAFCYNCGAPSDEFSNLHHYCSKCNT